MGESIKFDKHGNITYELFKDGSYKRTTYFYIESEDIEGGQINALIQDEVTRFYDNKHRLTKIKEKDALTTFDYLDNIFVHHENTYTKYFDADISFSRPTHITDIIDLRIDNHNDISFYEDSLGNWWDKERHSSAFPYANIVKLSPAFRQDFNNYFNSQLNYPPLDIT